MHLTIRRAFKFKLRPSKSCEQRMLQMIGACRFVWNKMLALNLARLRRKQRVLHWVAMLGAAGSL